MVNEGIAPDRNQARSICWTEFKTTPEYTTLFVDFKEFIINTAKHFSEMNE